jgi:uncharacterized protein HemY
MDWGLIATILGVLAALFAIVGTLFGGGRKLAAWFRERKSKKANAKRRSQSAPNFSGPSEKTAAAK